MKFLGLDIATKTGFALLDESGIIEYGKVGLNPKQTHIERFQDFRQQIKDLVLRLQPDVIILEDTYSKFVATTTYLNRLGGIAIGVLPDKIKLIIGRVSTMRSQLVHKQTKEAVFEWAVAEFKLDDLDFKKDNDITDAVLLAVWGMSDYKKGQ